MLRLTVLALGSSLAVFTLACGGDDASSPGSPSNSSGGPSADGGSNTTTPGNNGNTPASSVVNPELEGTWLTGCVQEYGKWYGHWKLVIDKGIVRSTYRQYNSDATCSDAAKLAAEWLQVTREWTLGDRSAKPIPLSRTLDVSTIRVVDAELKAIWDTQSSCGPHALGVAEDVRGKTCWNLWAPTDAGVYYDVIELLGPDAFLLGLFGPGRNGKTPETRPATTDARMLYSREGTEAGFIEATIDGQLVRANQRPTSPSVATDFVQISAATAQLPPWKTWVLQVPRTTGSFTCKTAASPTYINYGFTQNNLPVLWDTEQSGGNDCAVTITKAPTGRGDTIEGTFSGVLGDGSNGAHQATGGSFKIRLTQ